MTEPVFGSILRDARVRRGISIDDAARTLRIRTDILQAIENGDFQRMPPRSFARNMIVAYAKILDISPDDILKRYDDEFYSYQIGRKRQPTEASYSYRYANTPQPKPKRTTSNRVSQSARDASRARGRDHYEISGYQTDARRTQQQSPRRGEPRARSSASARHSSYRRSRHSVAPGPEYLNVYASPRMGTKRRFPRVLLIVIAAIVVIALILLIRNVACSSSAVEGGGSAPSITGLNDPEQSGLSTSTGQNHAAPIAPTAAVFSYQVLRDQSAYVEIYIDDALQYGGTKESGSHDTYDVTTTLRFDTTNPDGVALTVNGDRVEPHEIDGTGVYRYTVNFQEYLEQWKQDHASELNPQPEQNQPQDTGTTTQGSDGTQGSNGSATSPSLESAMSSILTQENMEMTTGVNATSSGISTTVNS